MAETGQHDAHDTAGGGHAAGAHAGGTVQLLERLDNWAHVVVAAFFILMATTVIVHMGFIFLRQVPLIIPPARIADSREETVPTPATTTAAPAKSDNRSQPATGRRPADSGTGRSAAQPEVMAAGESPRTEETSSSEHSSEPADPFVRNSLELLSNILFVVILLELLRTIITYLETHDIQAIMQEFLVVGIISSVRKILLVGAEASLIGSKGRAFIEEASGVVIDIVGILLLIVGLVLLKRAFGDKAQKQPLEA